MATVTKKKHFIPLESNPELFTELIHRLGMSKRLAFHDVLTLSPSDTELLSLIPRPALALVAVIPAPKGYMARVDEEEKDIAAYDLTGDKEDVMFYYQTIGNACGLYAALHAVANGDSRKFIEPNSYISRLIARTAPMNRAQRIEALETDEELEAAHASVASRGDTAAPEDPREPAVFAYMAFARSHKNGRLYQIEGGRKGPIDLDCVLGDDEDLLSEKALLAVSKFMEKEGQGIAVGYSVMAMSVTEPEV